MVAGNTALSCGQQVLTCSVRLVKYRRIKSSFSFIEMMSDYMQGASKGSSESRSLRKATIVLLLAVIVASSFLVFIILNSVLPRAHTPILSVSNVSLNPNEINVNDSSTLTFTIQNNDASRQHSAKVGFNPTGPITFYQNGIPLFEGIDGFQYSSEQSIYPLSSEQSTYTLRVPSFQQRFLPSTSTYSIRIEFIDENYRIFHSETVTLKVDQ